MLKQTEQSLPQSSQLSRERQRIRVSDRTTVRTMTQGDRTSHKVSDVMTLALAERVSLRASLRSEQIKIMHHLEQSMPGRGDKCEN